MWEVGAVGAVGRAVGVAVVTRCDRSRRADSRGRMSSCVADSFATLEESGCRLVRSSWFSLRTSEIWSVIVPSWEVMATMPETVAQRMERMDPSPAVTDCRAWGLRGP